MAKTAVPRKAPVAKPSSLRPRTRLSKTTTTTKSSSSGLQVVKFGRLRRKAQLTILQTMPGSRDIWNAYLAVNYDTIPAAQNGKVWKFIAGNIGTAYGPTNENSCAARISYALNYGGAPIPDRAQTPFGASKNFATAQYLGKYGDGKNYIVSAANMQNYLTDAWGQPSQRVNTVADLQTLNQGLNAGQCAVFATGGPNGRGHSGLLRAGYQDPFVATELPVDVWKLPA